MQQKELASRAGLPYSTVNGYLTKGRGIPVEAVQKMAEALDVSISTLVNEKPLVLDSLELTKDEGQIISNFRTLTRDQQEIILKNISIMMKQNSEGKR